MQTVRISMADVQQYDIHGFTYCGRGKGGTVPTQPGVYGWLGNPIPVGKTCPVCGGTHLANEAVIPCYRKYLWHKIQDEHWCRTFFDACWLKVLVCFCKTTEACHTDVIIRALYWLHSTRGWGEAPTQEPLTLIREICSDRLRYFGILHDTTLSDEKIFSLCNTRQDKDVYDLKVLRLPGHRFEASVLLR